MWIISMENPHSYHYTPLLMCVAERYDLDESKLHGEIDATHNYHTVHLARPAAIWMVVHAMSAPFWKFVVESGVT